MPDNSFIKVAVVLQFLMLKEFARQGDRWAQEEVLYVFMVIKGYL